MSKTGIKKDAKPRINIRSKGQSGEREAIDMLQPIVDSVFGKGAYNLERNLEQVRHGGADIANCPVFCVEIKRQEQLSKKAWWKQIMAACGKHEIPVVLYRQNRKSWQAMIPAYKLVKGSNLNQFVECNIEVYLLYFEEQLVLHKRDQEMNGEE